MIVVVAIGISMYVNQWISYRIEYYKFTCLPQIQRHNKTNPDFTIAIGQLIINSNHYYVKTQKYQAHTVTKLTNLKYYIYHTALNTFTLFLLTTFDIHVIVMLYDLGAVIAGAVSGSLL